jgi:poly(hydroxyalkanoate) granule-associated protein
MAKKEAPVTRKTKSRKHSAGTFRDPSQAVRDQANEADGKWDKLEQVFDDRVSRSLNRMGVLTGREVSELSRHVQELNETVRNIMGGAGKKAGGPKKRSAGSLKKAGAKKAGAKKAGAKKAKRSSRKASAR